MTVALTGDPRHMVVRDDVLLNRAKLPKLEQRDGVRRYLVATATDLMQRAGTSDWVEVYGLLCDWLRHLPADHVAAAMWAYAVDLDGVQALCRAVAAGQDTDAPLPRLGPLEALHTHRALNRIGECPAVVAEREAEARRKAAEAKLRRHVATEEDRDAMARRVLEVDGDARRGLGLTLGGKIGRRADGDVVHAVRCPSCSRPSVWWVIEPTRWRGCACEHRNSCGWTGRLYDLALLG